jgi:hypothetical protein
MCGIEAALAMFFGALEWQCCNKAKYIVNHKVESSFMAGTVWLIPNHERRAFFSVRKLNGRKIDS